MDFPEYKYIAVGGPLFCHYHYYLGRYILNWEKVQEQFMKLKIQEPNLCELHFLASNEPGIQYQTGCPSDVYGNHIWVRAKTNNELVLPWVYFGENYYDKNVFISTFICSYAMKYIISNHRWHRAILMDNCKQDISPSKYIILTKDGISKNCILRYHFANNGIDLPHQDTNSISLHFYEMQNIINSVQELHVLPSKTPGTHGHGYPAGQYGNNIYWRLKFADNTKTLWTFEERVKNPNDYLYSCLNGKYIKQASEYLRKTAKIKQY